jgi:hypothetical protein
MSSAHTTLLMITTMLNDCDWTFILPSKFPTKKLRHLPRKMPPQAYQQYMVLRGGIFVGKWRSTFAGNADGKMKVQSACALNTL